MLGLLLRLKEERLGMPAGAALLGPSIDLTGAPIDPVHQAMQSASEDYKRGIRGLTGAQFDAAYVAPQTNMHSFVLHVVEEGQKVATGDTKKLLDEMRPVVEAHLDHAKSLTKGLTFAPTAVGGGPGAEGAPMGSVQGGMGKGDAGRHEEPKKPGQKSNP